ncbi:GNAT family N-acetyltransferase [Streptomyces lavenduligriseus]|uniref:GNAT family N-acetyltransferase n=1 Tax=Streptomyces lavenduligriseus TaxID=67315 RepID=A0ABT0P7P8_9ACTN|nr:GNAT family N-acetyltransferase [Streptomyces lavenduligriseus]MCL3999037.1 GNAT family N-acetyltransferase [Streptomyces lavenduligriseus]
MGRASRRRAERRNALQPARPDTTEAPQVYGRYLIRPATPGDDPQAVHALLQPVDFMDAAMPREITDRMRTGWRMPAEFGAANLLLAQERETGEVVGLAHAIPPVQWLMEAGLGWPLCLMLSRALVELEAVSVADSARGQGLGHRLVDALVRSYTRQGYQVMLGGIHTHKPHLKPYYEADGFHVLGPGTPLDLELPIGRLRYPAELSMRHLVRPLAGHVAYRHGVVTGLLAGR